MIIHKLIKFYEKVAYAFYNQYVPSIPTLLESW